MSLLQINLFGGVEVVCASGESVLIPSRKAATLLGYVALSSPRAISRGKLATLLWDGHFGDRARASLRQALLTLRRELPRYSDVIVADRDDIRICPNAVSTDVGEFERLLTGAIPNGWPARRCFIAATFSRASARPHANSKPGCRPSARD